MGMMHFITGYMDARFPTLPLRLDWDEIDLIANTQVTTAEPDE